MRFNTNSRFSNLQWQSKQLYHYILPLLFMLLSNLCFELCNARHFIDPYLQDIRSIRDFQPRKNLFNHEQFILEPLEARLTHHEPRSIMQHESNVVEIRVKPPEGFPNFPSDSATVVRTVSSVSEKISRTRKTQKPFINADIGSSKEESNKQTEHQNYVIKIKKNTKKPVVVMKELPKPTKEAMVNLAKKTHNVAKKTFIDEGVVVSIEKKMAPSKNGTNIYRIKKRRKIEKKTRPNFDPRKQVTTEKYITTTSTSVTTSTTTTGNGNSDITSTFYDPLPVTSRPNFDPRKRKTTESSTKATSATTGSENRLNSDLKKSTFSDPLPVTEEVLFMPTPVPLIQNKADSVKKLNFEELTMSFNRISTAKTSTTSETSTSSSNNRKPKSRLKVPFPVPELDTEETTISFNKLLSPTTTSATSTRPNYVPRGFKESGNSTLSFIGETLKSREFLTSSFQSSKHPLLSRKLPTPSPLVSSENYDINISTKSKVPKFSIFNIAKTADFDTNIETTTEVDSDYFFIEQDFKDYESATFHEPRNFEILKTVKLTDEGEREEENNNDQIDYKSRSLKIFPRINRRQKKPPKFVAIPLSKPRRPSVSSKIPPPPPPPPRPPPPPPPSSSKPQPTLVVKPIRPQVPSKVRLYYTGTNKRKRKVVKQVKDSGLRGYGKTIEAFKNRENSSKPFKPSPDFEDRPIRNINAAHERIQPTSKIIGIITGKLEPFEETQEGITIPVFPEQLSWATNWNSDFGLKITTPPTASKKVTFNPVISPKIKRDFSANSRIKVNPIGVVNFDTKWHPVSSDSTLTSKLVYSEPYILDEGSDKTLGGFIGKDKSSDDSVAKLLVKDPYHELQKESVFTDRIDQFVPPSYGDISYPTEEVEEPYQAAHEYHRQPVYEPVQPVYESRQPVYESRQPVYEPVFREDYEPRKTNYQEDHHHYHTVTDEPSPYPYNTAFNDQDHSTNNYQDPWRSGRKMTLPVIKNDNFPGIVRHISTYTSRSLSSSADLVDFGAATGGHGSFGWYSDHPVGTRIHEGLFA